MAKLKIKLPEAEMLCDAGGELWTVFVRGHVPTKRFDGAFWELMRGRFQDAHERFDETGEKYVNCVIEHLYLRPTRFDDGDMGQCYKWCRPSAKTGFPVTAIRFGNGRASTSHSLKGRIMGERMTEKQIRQQAYDTVVRVRGSDDVKER